MDNLKLLFVRNQKLLLDFANTKSGRLFLEIPQDEKIVGITPTAYYLDKGSRVEGIFRTYPLYAKKIGIPLTNNDIIKGSQYDKGEYKNLLHYAGIKRQNFMPTILHDTHFAGAEDGYITATDLVWANARGATTGTLTGADATLYCTAATGFTIRRIFLPFTGIATGTKTAASIFLKENGFGTDTGVVLHAVNSTQGDSLAGADYNNVSFTSDGSKSSITDNAYNEIVLNATGIANITTTAKFAILEEHDQANSEPAATYRFQCHASEQTSTTQDPYLSVTFLTINFDDYAYFM